jgi:hypothetical protein
MSYRRSAGLYIHHCHEKWSRRSYPNVCSVRIAREWTVCEHVCHGEALDRPVFRRSQAQVEGHEFLTVRINKWRMCRQTVKATSGAAPEKRG